jgi:prepilin-type N-terminal cleavage/methylation domain-containing protein/prepilin-type processing-associated H-X9-DG protein
MRYRAFTLVELLVVITIIALLGAISFAVFGSVRQRARMIACRANIHQLLKGLYAYDAEHQSLPYGYDLFDVRKNGRPPGGGMGSPTYVVPGWWWYHQASGMRVRYTEGLKLLRCPSSKLDDPVMDRDIVCGKYGVNRALCKVSPSLSRPLYEKDFVGTPLSLGSLKQPGSTLLIADSGFALLCWWNVTADPPVKLDPACIEDTAYVPGLEINKDKILWSGQSTDAIGGRHPHRTVNVGFADGHADAKPANDLLVEKTEDGRYTNTRLWLGQ